MEVQIAILNKTFFSYKLPSFKSTETFITPLKLIKAHK